jgi:hypothetical protein
VPRPKESANQPAGSISSDANPLRNMPHVNIPGKSIGVLGVPDTVNEARIRALVPSHLSLESVEMKPENGGAILVFQKEPVPASC